MADGGSDYIIRVEVRGLQSRRSRATFLARILMDREPCSKSVIGEARKL